MVLMLSNGIERLRRSVELAAVWVIYASINLKTLVINRQSLNTIHGILFPTAIYNTLRFSF